MFKVVNTRGKTVLETLDIKIAKEYVSRERRINGTTLFIDNADGTSYND